MACKLLKFLILSVYASTSIGLKLRLSAAIQEVDLKLDLALSEEGHYENALWCKETHARS